MKKLRSHQLLPVQLLLWLPWRKPHRKQILFYAGAKAGWASVRHGLNQYQYRDESDGAVIGKAKINSEAYGVFGGYQITDNFAIEAGYEFFGRGKVKRVQRVW